MTFTLEETHMEPDGMDQTGEVVFRVHVSLFHGHISKFLNFGAHLFGHSLTSTFQQVTTCQFYACRSHHFRDLLEGAGTRSHQGVPIGG